MTWRRIDDGANLNNTTWSALATQRKILNYGEVLIHRQNEASWGWNALAHNNTNVTPIFLTRFVSLGSKSPRDRGMLWSCAPHPFTTDLELEILAELPTQPGVTVQWYLMTSADPTMHKIAPATVSIGTGNTGPIPAAIYTFDISLAAVQGGAKRPETVFLFLEVISETSTNPGDVETYSRNNPGAGGNDYRGTSQVGLRYGTRMMETQSTFLRDIDMYEITGVISQDPKGATFTSAFAYQERPFEVILRDVESVIWIPAMSDYLYPDLNSSLQITRIGELRLAALTVREVVGVPAGPASGGFALVRGLSGARACKGPEHAQIHGAQDQLAYGRVPIFSYGPQISSQAPMFLPPPLIQADSITTGAAPLVFIEITNYHTLTEWRIGDDSEFKGDIPNSQRRDIQIVPMWLLLSRSDPPLDVHSVNVRFTFHVAGSGDVGTHDITIDITPYSSEYTRNCWFGSGLAYQLWFEMRTATSSSASFPRAEIPDMLSAMFTDPITIPAPVLVADNTYLRMEVKHDSAINFEGSLILTDLGTIVRAQPSWSNDGTNIEAVTRDT